MPPKYQPISNTGETLTPAPQGEVRVSQNPEIPAVETESQKAETIPREPTETAPQSISPEPQEMVAAKVEAEDQPDFKGVDHAAKAGVIDKEALIHFDALTAATSGKPHEQMDGYQHMRHEYLEKRFDFPVPDTEEKAA